MPRIISWNVKGLRSPQKRMMVLHHLKKLKVDIALLQETHLGTKDFGRMCRLWVGEVVESAGQGRKARVLILVRKNFKINISQVEHDSKGRRVSVIAMGPSFKYRVTNIYAPNSPTQSYFPKLSSWLVDHVHQNNFPGGILTLSCSMKRTDHSPLTAGCIHMAPSCITSSLYQTC